jgi:hypothetical protein
MAKLHYADLGCLDYAACGARNAAVTTDKDKVTCKRCRRMGGFVRRGSVALAMRLLKADHN